MEAIEITLVNIKLAVFGFPAFSFTLSQQILKKSRNTAPGNHSGELVETKKELKAGNIACLCHSDISL